MPNNPVAIWHICKLSNTVDPFSLWSRIYRIYRILHVFYDLLHTLWLNSYALFTLYLRKNGLRLKNKNEKWKILCNKKFFSLQQIMPQSIINAAIWCCDAAVSKGCRCCNCKLLSFLKAKEIKMPQDVNLGRRNVSTPKFRKFPICPGILRAMSWQSKYTDSIMKKNAYSTAHFIHLKITLEILAYVSCPATPLCSLLSALMFYAFIKRTWPINKLSFHIHIYGHTWRHLMHNRINIPRIQ